MERINEIQARLAEINAALDNATGEALTALEEESRGLLEEMNRLKGEVEARQQLRSKIAAGAGTPSPIAPKAPEADNDAEKRAAAFVKSNRMTIGADEARATLISSGQLIKPMKNSTEIEEIPGAKVSSIIDLVHIEDCTGMSSYQVPYTVADADAAGEQTEGAAGSVSELGQWDFVDIKPTNVLVLGQISKQAKKQTNVKYAAKVQQNALLALRKKAAAIVTNALKASTLVREIPATAGKIEANTLRNLTLQYGDDESVLGNAYLFLNKADLIAFGDVRGTNEKKAVYTITPDAGNPNTGTISEGGLTVPYVLNSGLTALSAATEGAGKTMFYGAPKTLHVGMFSDYEVRVSEDFAFDKLLDTIRGDLEMGADVAAKHSFVTLKV
jgi:HK97 family phage major capsid protein